MAILPNYESDTYPFLEQWLLDYIARNHDVFDNISTMTNQWFNFGCRYEFDIIAGFQTAKRKILRTYNIEVKINGDIKGLFQQGFRNNGAWFDYTFVAVPLARGHLSYFIDELCRWKQFLSELQRKIRFGVLLFDWKHKEVYPLVFPLCNKHLLGKKERNKILVRLGFNPPSLLGGY